MKAKRLICAIFAVVILSLSFFTVKYDIKFYGGINSQNFGISTTFGGFEFIGDFGYFICQDQC